MVKITFVITGREPATLELPEGATVADLKDIKSQMVAFVNGAQASAATPLRTGDTVVATQSTYNG